MAERSWADRVEALQERLDMTQQEFADLLGLTVQTVNRWVNLHFEPNPWTASTIEALERDPEGALEKLKRGERISRPRPPEWSPLELRSAWPPERVKELLLHLDLNGTNLAQLLNIGESTVSLWLSGKRNPGVCSTILLDLLERHGGEMVKLLFETDVPVELTGEEVRSILEGVSSTIGNNSVANVARFVRISPANFYNWMAKGTTDGCIVLFLALLRKYTDDMISAIRDRD